MFAGRWIGETQEADMPAHVWEITSQGSRLYIETRWESETSSGRMSASALADEPAFLLGEKKAELLGTQHFIIREWDTNDTRGGVGPHYDVVFSRPGLAELRAYEVWQEYLAARGEAPRP